MSGFKKPAERIIVSATTLPDGRIRYVFNTGAVAVTPPIPESQVWREHAAREISSISYKIIRNRMTKNTPDAKTADEDKIIIKKG